MHYSTISIDTSAGPARAASVRPATLTGADIDHYLREGRRQRSAAAHRLFARLGRGLRRLAA